MATLSRRIQEAYSKTRESWGGATLHFPTMEWVPNGIDAYAVTVKDNDEQSISIPEDASRKLFNEAFLVAVGSFQATEWIGIFHDDVKGTIDFDPVTVVATKRDVDRIAKTHKVIGGAYHFATGDGYWPQGRPVEYEVIGS